MGQKHIQGIFAATVTPLKEDFSPDCVALIEILAFLAQRGCHGVLLLGTTGEGPSFSPDQRKALLSSALDIRQSFPDFKLLAGTGTPSLDETLQLTQSAFDLGFDGVVVLPPYYYKNVSVEGLYKWFETIISRAVPSDGHFYGYHIPPVSGVGLPLELLVRLKDRFPNQFAGIKDSSADPAHAILLGETFSDRLDVFTGNDGLFLHALQNHACGCITAAANVVSPLLRLIWDEYQAGHEMQSEQLKLTELRKKFDRFSPAPALLKALLSARYRFPRWPVLPPIQPIDPARFLEAMDLLSADLDNAHL